MVLLHPKLSTKPEADPGLDQRQLFALGMDYIRMYSRRLWSDHNAHDPGITASDCITYALTELTYRAGFPLEDLLAADDGGAGMAAQFYTARQVLPNGALTLLDFRKLLLDVPGVQNAWVSREPLTYYADLAAAALRPDNPGGPAFRPVDVRGLYRARVAFDDDVTEATAKDAVRAEALKTLRTNRNLCEDFVAVDAVPDQWFALCAEIELEPGADAEGVAARVLFDVDDLLAPRVRRYSLEEMLAKTDPDGNPDVPDTVFNGPTPDHGFVDPAELLNAELRTEIRLSDVISAVMNVYGVRAVRDLVVNALKPPPIDPPPAGDIPELVPVEPANKWRVPVAPGHRPQLSRAHGRLVLYKGDIPVLPDSAAVDARLKTLIETVRQAARSTAGVDLTIPLGRPRASASYRSVQNEFPAVYGISEDGLPSDADPARRAAALQFQGYLLFFDQVMANFCAQLANLHTLFTRDETAGPTYACQPVTTFRDYTKIYPEAANDGEIAAQLAPLFESQDDALRRRDRYLDHSLARIASDFHEYVGVMTTTFGGSVAGSVATKRAFLRTFPEQAARRGQGYDLLGSGSDSLNVSGVERRLASLLDLRATHTVVDAAQQGTTGFVFAVKHPADGHVLLASPEPLATEAEARAAMLRAIDLGKDAAAYDRSVTAEGRQTFVVVDADHKPIAGPPSSFATAEEMEGVIAGLISDLQALGIGESLALVEGLLLRPRPRVPAHPEDDEPFLPICINPDCTGCADDDPYSYQVQVVLPAEAGRFKNMDFRRFVESVVRREMPAHVMPRVCWADAARWTAFEEAHAAWKALRPDATASAHKEALTALITALQAVKNVYPEQKLQGCDAEGATPFILGRTALGSDKILDA